MKIKTITEEQNKKNLRKVFLGFCFIMVYAYLGIIGFTTVVRWIID